jgi:hypothetical protein
VIYSSIGSFILQYTMVKMTYSFDGLFTPFWPPKVYFTCYIGMRFPIDGYITRPYWFSSPNIIFCSEGLFSPFWPQKFYLEDSRHFWFIFQIWDKPDVLERFQNQFWKLHLLPKKPRILWILGNILLYLFGVSQLGYF